MINYTILKSSIINSSIWNEDSDTRCVWVTMLAMRNKDGEIFASVGGLAHASRVSIEKTRQALAKFLAPEADSSGGDDGRRIEIIQGGWRLMNHERVTKEAAMASKAAYMREYMRNKRKLPDGKSLRAHLKEQVENDPITKADKAAMKKKSGKGASPRVSTEYDLHDEGDNAE